MAQLTHADLYKLEDYARERPEFRRQVLAHKRVRTVALGPHLTFVFEDRLTVQYQIQEMLRIERIFDAAAIQEEFDAYNPLIPDGRNLKATLLIEYPDRDERARRLRELNGIERMIRLEIAGQGAAELHADEDLPRATEDKTSAVHFLRFELSAAQAQAAKGGATITLAVDHPRYAASVVLADDVRRSLAADLA